MCSCWTSSGYSEVLWQGTVMVIQRDSGGLPRTKDIMKRLVCLVTKSWLTLLRLHGL